MSFSQHRFLKRSAWAATILNFILIIIMVILIGIRWNSMPDRVPFIVVGYNGTGTSKKEMVILVPVICAIITVVFSIFSIIAHFMSRTEKGVEKFKPLIKMFYIISFIFNSVLVLANVIICVILFYISE